MSRFLLLTERLAPRISPVHFGIVLGLGGLAGCWRISARIGVVPANVGDDLAMLAIAAWLILLACFVVERLRFPDLLRSEMRDPLKAPFLALLPMATLVIAAQLHFLAPTAAMPILAVGILAQVSWSAWLLGRQWQGIKPVAVITPADFLPAEGGFLVSAMAAGTCGYPELGLPLWGAGFIKWVIWESIVIHRLLDHPLPVAQRATMGIHATPATLACSAYLAITPGPPDRVAQALFGYALLQVVVLGRCYNWLTEQPFGVPTWAYTFGVASLTAAALLCVERGLTGPVAWAALPLFLGANIVIGGIAIRSTARLLRRGRATL